MNKKIPVELLLVDIATLALLAVIFLLPESVLRIILGLPFALFFPGYVLVAAVFPRKGDAGNIRRLTLGLAISFALTAIIAIIFNYTPLGINLYPMIFSLTALIIVASLVAWYRWLRLPPDARYVAPFDFWTALFRGGKLDRVLSLLVAAAVIIAFAVLIFTVWMPKTGESFTEFYMLGMHGHASDYPLDLEAGSTGHVTLGIVNRESHEMDYSVSIREHGEAPREIARVTLQPEEVWEQRIEFSSGSVGEYKKIEFLLFTEDKTEPYRSLHIRVNVQSWQ